MSEDTKDIVNGLRNIGLFALVFAPLVLCGLYYPQWWAMLLAGAMGGALMGKFATKGSWVNIGAWAAIGAAAGIGFYFAV